MSVPRCPGCGHNHYDGGSGYCKWCKEEQANPIKCYICGGNADASGRGGYVCKNCYQADDDRQEEKRRQADRDEESESWRKQCEWEEENGPSW